MSFPLQFVGAKRLAPATTASFTAGGIGHDNANSSSYSISSLAIGAAPTGGQTRHVVAVVTKREGGAADTFTATAVTIGGVSATKLHETTARREISWWIAEVPTGTTIDLDVTFDGSVDRCNVAVFSIMNLSSPTDDTDNDDDDIGDGSNTSTTVTVLPGGCCLVASLGLSSSAGTPSMSGDVSASANGGGEMALQVGFANSTNGASFTANCDWTGSSKQNASMIALR